VITAERNRNRSLPFLLLLFSVSLLFILLSSTIAYALLRKSAATPASLYHAHQWFALREALKKTRAEPLYEGAVACAFNEQSRCEKILGMVIQTRPRSDEAMEAHGILEQVYFRSGAYRHALSELDALLAVKPDAPGAESVHALLAVLARFPDQSAIQARASQVKVHVEGKDLGVPLSVNGIPATFIFDTGANVSILSASEAERLKLKVMDVSARMGVVTGGDIAVRIAVADEMKVGDFRLRNVAFIVVSDNAPPFDELAPGERGVIGIPVLMAFQSFSWDRNGTFEFGAASTQAAAPNLAFDGPNPVVQLEFHGHKLNFSLDTGAETTYIYPEFAREFPQLTGKGKKERRAVTGVGHKGTVESVTLPELRLQFRERPVILRPARVFLKATTEGSKWFHGNLGMDLLTQPQKTSIDFKSMTLIAQ